MIPLFITIYDKKKLSHLAYHPFYFPSVAYQSLKFRMDVQDGSIYKVMKDVDLRGLSYLLQILIQSEHI